MQCLVRQARQLSYRALSAGPSSTAQASRQQNSRQARHLSVTTSTRAQESETSSANSAPEHAATQSHSRQFYDKLNDDDKAQYESTNDDGRREMEATIRSLEEEMQSGSPTNTQLQSLVREYINDMRTEGMPPEPYVPLPVGGPPGSNNFFSNPVVETEYLGPDVNWMGDDISSAAHGELEQHRELRGFARLATWEMPLLANLQTPFQDPDKKKLPLRFRYTTYLGEHHAASKKVVVDFKPRDLGLTTAQETKFIKLAGSRFNPFKKTIKMSAESFDTQAQNKRFLGDTIAKLIETARDDSDSFEDIPLDFRHAMSKSKPRRTTFPREWVLTSERRDALQTTYKALDADDAKILENQKLVDGIKAIEQGRVAESAKIPLAVAAGPATRGARSGRAQQPTSSSGRQFA